MPSLECLRKASASAYVARGCAMFKRLGYATPRTELRKVHFVRWHNGHIAQIVAGGQRYAMIIFDLTRTGLAGLASAVLLAAIPAPLLAHDAHPVRQAPVVTLAETERQIDRIAQFDDAGPMLNAVIVYNADAAMVPAGIVTETALQGRTVLVKDNIETTEWPTTAGSLALANNRTGRDAPLIERLRASGGVVLGKTNLSEWANIRSSRSSSGWSAMGGQTRNPHAIDRTPCGSSSGSGAAVAAGLAWAAIGTETDGSITCPAAVNGIVGFKPTVGMVSRTHIIPISSSQDTAGPMANSVTDAAMLLTAIAGSDPLDPATAAAAGHATDFTAGLGTASLAGVRLGVMRGQVGPHERLSATFAAALRDLEAAGAVLVEIDYAPDEAMWADEYTVLLYELREGLGAYLQGSPADIPVRSLDDVIAFNRANAATELRWFQQETFEAAATATDRAEYERARANSLQLAGPEGIDRLLSQYEVAFLVAPTEGPAWMIDLVLGDNFTSGIGLGSLAAIAGYPHLTVPMGDVDGLPVGLSIIGPAWADHRVLQAGAAYERARTAELAAPAMARWTAE